MTYFSLASILSLFLCLKNFLGEIFSRNFLQFFQVSPSSHQSSSCPTAKSSTKSENNSIGSTTKTSSNSTIQLDYSRLKAEHRKLKKYFEVFFNYFLTSLLNTSLGIEKSWLILR